MTTQTLILEVLTGQSLTGREIIARLQAQGAQPKTVSSELCKMSRRGALVQTPLGGRTFKYSRPQVS
jgi:hypothetical protein